MLRSSPSRVAALFLVFVTVLLSVFVAVAPAALAERTTIEASWPEDGTRLLFPPRQGYLSFEDPVVLSSAILELTGPGLPAEGEPLSRVNRGSQEDRVVFRIPIIGEGEYDLSYRVRAVSGEQISGELAFSVAPKFAAVGGGNHRHGAGHLEFDTPGAVMLRLILVIGAALVFFSCWRASRSITSVLDAVLARLGGFLVLTTAGILGFTAAIGAALDSEDPLTAAVASPGPWLWLPVAALGALQVLAGRRDHLAAALAVAPLLAAAVTVDHGGDPIGLVTSLVYAAVLVAATLMLVILLQWLVYMVQTRPRSVVTLTRPLLASSLALAVLSLSLLPLHARGVEFNGAFASDLRLRVLAAIVLLLLASLAGLLARRQGKAWSATVAVILTGLVVAVTGILLLLPPPMAGL